MKRYPLVAAAWRRSRQPASVFVPVLALALTAAPGRAQSPSPAPPPLVVASLGSCELERGAAIPECRVAFRTYGRLNGARDNAILIPTYFAGRSEDHAFMLGTYVDTTRYHVIVADALADGLSSSPSNVAPATRGAFRDLTIGDMVVAHHRLLTEHLGIHRVRAVVGISMGAFQVFEWSVRFPDFAAAWVPIVGSPRVTDSDRLTFRALISGAENGSRSGVPSDSVWEQLSRIEALFMRTPEGLRGLGLTSVESEARGTADGYRRVWALEDYAAQMRAIERHDVSARFGGELSRAAKAVRAPMLVVYSPNDRMVWSGPGAEFARLAGAETLVVPSDCGHSVFWCEAERIGAVVRGFIGRGRVAASPSSPR